MKAKLLNDGAEKARAELKANHFTAIGAFSEAEVGFFQLESCHSLAMDYLPFSCWTTK